MLPTALIFRVPDDEEARIDDAEDVPTALLRMPQVLDWDPGCLVFGFWGCTPEPQPKIDSRGPKPTGELYVKKTTLQFQGLGNFLAEQVA